MSYLVEYHDERTVQVDLAGQAVLDDLEVLAVAGRKLLHALSKHHSLVFQCRIHCQHTFVALIADLNQPAKCPEDCFQDELSDLSVLKNALLRYCKPMQT